MRIPPALLSTPFVRWARLSPLLATLVLSTPNPSFGHGAAHEKIEQLTAALIENPRDAEKRFALAAALIEHGDWPLAQAHLDRVEEMAPGKFSIDLLRGEAWLASGQPAAAKQALDRFLDAHPGDARALAFRARSLAALGETRAGLADYRAALRHNPLADADLVQETADALAAHGQSEEAILVLTAGLSRLGPVPSLVLRAMDLEIKAGRFEVALTRVDVLQKTAPRPEPWMAKRAALLGQAGRTGEARAAWAMLAAHLAALPPLDRGSPAIGALTEEVRRALDQTSGPAPVFAPPASPISVSNTSSTP